MGFGNPTAGLTQASPWNELSQAIASMPDFKIKQLQAEQLQENVAQTGYQNLIEASLQNPQLATQPLIIKQMQQYATQMKIPPPITTNEAGIPSLDMKRIGSYAATQFVQANADKWFNWSPAQRLALSTAHNWNLSPDDPLISAPQSVSIFQQDEIGRNMQTAIATASKAAGQAGSETAFGAIFSMKKPFDEAMGAGAFDSLVTQIQPLILADVKRGTERLDITNAKDKKEIARITDQMNHADTLTALEVAYKGYQNIIEKYRAQYTPQEEAAKLANLQQRTKTSAAQAQRYRDMATKGGGNPIQRANFLKGAWQASGGQLKDLVHQAQALQYDIANAATDAGTSGMADALKNVMNQIQAAEPQYYSDSVAHAISTAQISGNNQMLAVAQMAESALEAMQGNTNATDITTMEQQDPKTFAILEKQFPDLVNFVKGLPTSYEQDAAAIVGG